MNIFNRIKREVTSWFMPNGVNDKRLLPAFANCNQQEVIHYIIFLTLYIVFVTISTTALKGIMNLNILLDWLQQCGYSLRSIAAIVIIEIIMSAIMLIFAFLSAESYDKNINIKTKLTNIICIAVLSNSLLTQGILSENILSFF